MVVYNYLIADKVRLHIAFKQGEKASKPNLT